jgi:hypothetical protein
VTKGYGADWMNPISLVDVLSLVSLRILMFERNHQLIVSGIYSYKVGRFR